jgi:hypothetical protein
MISWTQAGLRSADIGAYPRKGEGGTSMKYHHYVMGPEAQHEAALA